MKVFSAIVGVSIIILASFANHLMTDYSMFENSFEGKTGNVIYTEASTFAGTGSPTSFKNVAIRFEYSQEMKKNETHVAKLNYNISRTRIDPNSNKITPSEYPVLQSEKSITLSSSGVDISTQTHILKRGQKLPVLVAWTITPRSEGKHLMLLDVSDLVTSEPSDFKSLLINGEIKDDMDYKNIEIPITVFTIWGMTQRTFYILRLIAILTGGILSYPVIIEIFKKKVQTSFF